MTVDIPDKTYFKIGEVGRIIGVEPYNIRYWESQFRAIRPIKTKSNHRVYRRKDIEILLQIKQLLYEEGFTISGAKKRLHSLLHGEPEPEETELSPDEIGMATQERLAYEERLADVHGELVGLRSEVDLLQRELRLLREQSSQRSNSWEIERQELLLQAEAAKGDSQENQQKQRLIDELLADREQLANELERSERITSENEQLQQRLEELLQEQNRQRQDFEEVRRQNGRLQTTLEEAQNSFSLRLRQHKREQDNLREQLEASNQETSRLKTLLEENKSELGRIHLLDDRLESAKQRVALLEEELNGLRERAARADILREQLGAANSAMERLQRKNTLLRQEKKALIEAIREELTPLLKSQR